MTDQVSVDSAVNAALRMIQNQLNNTLSMLDTQTVNIADAINLSVDEYNEIVDTAEALQSQVDKLKGEADTLRAELAKTGDETQAEITLLNSQLTRANMAVADFSHLKRELEEMRKLNPARLQKKNKELRITNDERLKANQALKNNFNSVSKALANESFKLSKVTKLLTECNAEVEELRKRVNQHDGNVCDRPFEGANGLVAYIYDFCWGLTTKPNNEFVNTISDLDWHIEVRTNFGIGVIISVTEWLVPFYPICTELSESWPADIHQALASIILDRCQTSHPHLVDRYDWAKEVELERVPGITARQLKAFNDSNFLTLYSVCHIPPDRLHLMVKGIGKAACETIHRSCKAFVNDWEIENWTREERGLK